MTETYPESRKPAGRVLNGLDDARLAIGNDLGTSEWHEITQARIDQFADATGDHQWIHVDPERAALGPFGSTIAHGYLTLSLMPMLMVEVLDFAGVEMTVNYGLNRVRFPAPLSVGSSIRGRVRVVDVIDRQGDADVVFEVTVESRSSDRPVCVAEPVWRVVVGPSFVNESR